MDKNINNSRWVKAIHLAGHIVAIYNLKTNCSNKFFSLSGPDDIPQEKTMEGLIIIMGGKAAEQSLFTDYQRDVEVDITKATEIATEMVCSYGKDPKVGPISFKILEKNNILSNKLKEEACESIQDLIKKADSQAGHLMTRNMNSLKVIANALYEKGVLTNDEISEIFQKNKENS